MDRHYFFTIDLEEQISNYKPLMQFLFLHYPSFWATDVY